MVYMEYSNMADTMEQAFYSAVAPYMVTCGLISEIILLALALPRNCRQAIISRIPARLWPSVYADTLAFFVSKRSGINIHGMLQLGIPKSLQPSEKRAYPMWYLIERVALNGAPLTNTTVQLLALVPQEIAEERTTESLMCGASLLCSPNMLKLVTAFTRPAANEITSLNGRCLFTCAVNKQATGNVVLYLVSQMKFVAKDTNIQQFIQVAITNNNKPFIEYLALAMEKAPADAQRMAECALITLSFTSHNMSIINQIATGRWNMAQRIRAKPELLGLVKYGIIEKVFGGLHADTTRMVKIFKLNTKDFADDTYGPFSFGKSGVKKPSDTIKYLMQPPFCFTSNNFYLGEFIIYLVEHEPSALHLIAEPPLNASREDALYADVLSLIVKLNAIESMTILGEAPYSIRGEDIRAHNYMPLRVAAVSHNRAMVALFLSEPFYLNGADIAAAIRVMTQHVAIASTEAEMDVDDADDHNDLDIEEYDAMFNFITKEMLLSGIEFLCGFMI